MLKLTLLNSATRLAAEFERCCRSYESLDFATAWCGNPRPGLPYKYLHTFGGPIKATVGQHFNQTHPDAIESLTKAGVNLRVFKKTRDVFHPKAYIFSSEQVVAIFVGSSNLTFSGFYRNEEMNILLEGVPDPHEEAQVNALKKQLDYWHSDACSFVPSFNWIARYRKDFLKTFRRQKKYHIESPSQYENSIASASWLSNASWGFFWQKLQEGLKKHNRTTSVYHGVLSAAEQKLPLPWKLFYLDDVKSRALILGSGSFGWLGNAGAAGGFRHLLANGTLNQRQTIVDAVSAIGAMNPPIDWRQVRHQLVKLTLLGPTMKVWGRLLCLVRPDLYCTVLCPRCPSVRICLKYSAFRERVFKILTVILSCRNSCTLHHGSSRQFQLRRSRQMCGDGEQLS
jgi:hypothetical protein